MKSLYLAVALLSVFAAACGKTQDNPKPEEKISLGSLLESADKLAKAGASAAANVPVEVKETELTAGGAKWKGWSAKLPENAKLADDGAGGLSIACGDYQVSVTQEKPHIKDIKGGVTMGAEIVKGKVTYTTDKPDAIEYETSFKDVVGSDVTMRGFAYQRKVGDKPIGCSCGDAMNKEDLAAARAICESISKK